MFRQVPVLPIVIPLAAAAFAALLLSLHRRGRLSAPRAAVALAMCVYAGGVVANTVFPIFLNKPVSSAPWSSHLAIVPLVGYEVADAIVNILVFVPLGIVVPLMSARASWGRALGVTACLSLTIELVQYVTAHLVGGGHIADVNDLLFNVLGGALGFAVFSVLSRGPGADVLINRFRWHDDTVRTIDAAAPPPASDTPISRLDNLPGHHL